MKFSIKIPKQPLSLTLTLGAGCFILIMMPIWWLVCNGYKDRLLEEQKAQDRIGLELIKNSISHAMSRRSALFEGLCAFVESNPSEDHLDSELMILMTGLYNHTRGVRSLSFAPEGIQRFVYPLKGNEMVIGHDILHDQRPHIQKAMKRALQTGKIIFNGPYELRQGGLALVLRKAIFSDGRFWGLAAMVIDVPPILEESGLMLRSNDMQFALRDKEGKIFHGNKRINDSDPLTMKVELLDGHWELAGVPIDGWHAHIAGKLRFFQVLSFIISFLITTIAFLVFFRQKDLKLKIKNKTAELSDQMKAVRDSEERFDLAMRFANDGVYDWNLETNEVYFSPGWKRMLGYDDHEILNEFSEWERLTKSEDVEASRRMLNEVLKGRRERFEKELQMRHKDGHWVEILSRANIIFNEAGKGVRVVGTHVDISIRKKMEKSLRDSRARFKAIAEHSPFGISIVDIDGIPVFSNPAFTSMMGYTQEEFKGLDFTKITYPEDLEKELPLYKEVLEGKRDSYHIEKRNIHKDGHLLWINAHLVAVRDDDGDLKYFIGLCEDITNRKNAEEELRQAHKMEAIGTLAGGIAHDFNNLLSAIIGFTELTLEDVKQDSSAVDNLQEVYAAGKRAKDLVRQILTFARQSEEKTIPIQIDKITKEALRFIRSSIPTTIEIISHIDSEAFIMGNPTQVHQILLNLCTNAAQAMADAGGVLEVGLQDVVIDKSSDMFMKGLKPGEYIEIRVSDTGDGIDPDVIQSVFEPYYTTKGPGEGTGMGLAVVHGIVESGNGQVDVESQPGKGTTFNVYLPVTNNREFYGIHEPEGRPEYGTERILFVDDEAPIANIGRIGLERLGYKVTTRTSSLEALELFKSKPDDFDLVITDMTMPNMTGDVLAAGLMKIRPEIPVILCTGYSNKISAESAARIGIKAFCSKPIVKADLAATIRKVLDEGI